MYPLRIQSDHSESDRSVSQETLASVPITEKEPYGALFLWEIYFPLAFRLSTTKVVYPSFLENQKFFFFFTKKSPSRRKRIFCGTDEDLISERELPTRRLVSRTLFSRRKTDICIWRDGCDIHVSTSIHRVCVHSISDLECTLSITIHTRCDT